MVAAQVLRAMALNYPTIVSACWERVSVLVYKLLQFAVVEDPAKTWKASVKEPVGYVGDKILTAAIKVGLCGVDQIKSSLRFIQPKQPKT